MGRALPPRDTDVKGRRACLRAVLRGRGEDKAVLTTARGHKTTTNAFLRGDSVFTRGLEDAAPRFALRNIDVVKVEAKIYGKLLI